MCSGVVECTGYIMHNERDVSIQGHCVIRNDSFGDQESQKICAGTRPFGTSRSPTAVLMFKFFILAGIETVHAVVVEDKVEALILVVVVGYSDVHSVVEVDVQYLSM